MNIANQVEACSHRLQSSSLMHNIWRKLYWYL